MKKDKVSLVDSLLETVKTIADSLDNFGEEFKEFKSDVLDFIHSTDGRLDDLEEKLEEKKQPKRKKNYTEVMLDCLKYCRHRFNKHDDSGIHKCLTPEEFETVKKEIKTLEEEVEAFNDIFED